MATFEYIRWSGATRQIEADRVEFTPAHVVFRRFDHSIVVAETNANVNELKQLIQDDAP